jgi:hypothetical protein
MAAIWRCDIIPTNHHINQPLRHIHYWRICKTW